MTLSRRHTLALAPGALLAAGPRARAAPAPEGKGLVLRNVGSWNRAPDFEATLANLGIPFESRSAAAIADLDLARYRLVIIPGAQWKTGFYKSYAASAARFDRYVSEGGVLALELNGAEDDGLPLPRGVTIVKNAATDNTIVLPGHPVVQPMGGKPIHANFASHGYLRDVPPDALVLVTESADGPGKPTFVEYSYGAGRVLAACQCFHDQDHSGRGPMMRTLVTYAADRHWYAPPRK
jgi:hypothetical protein